MIGSVMVAGCPVESLAGTKAQAGLPRQDPGSVAGSGPAGAGLAMVLGGRAV